MSDQTCYTKLREYLVNSLKNLYEGVFWVADNEFKDQLSN